MPQNSYIWPLKCVNLIDGLLSIFDVEKHDDMQTMDIRVIYCDYEWIVAIQDRFCIPVSLIGIDGEGDRVLYLAGSSSDDVEAKVFAKIPLDLRTLAKIAVIIEMAGSS